MAQKADPDSRRFVKELAQMECVLVGAMTEEKAWLSRVDESALRWALSLARVSMVQMPKGEREGSADIGHATDIYRQRLYDLLTPFVSEGRVKNRDELVQRIPQIRKLVAGERQELIELYRNSITAAALDNAVRRRPLALALSGGGGTSYVFTGAFAELEEAGIKPSGLAGSSMGAVLGAYRALHSDFDLADFKRVMGSLSWDKVVQPFQQGSRFGVPSTFRLYLREVFGHEFERDGRFLRLCDLAIPLRVVVAGIPHIEGAPDTDLAPYAHLLDDIGLNPRELKKNEKGITRALLELATKPLRAIYLGQDELSRYFARRQTHGGAGERADAKARRGSPNRRRICRQPARQRGEEGGGSVFWQRIRSFCGGARWLCTQFVSSLALFALDAYGRREQPQGPRSGRLDHHLSPRVVTR
jgi:hypothetical protein